ncbi:unnamed protein product [Mytilus coruscus]|uniref:Uncharacterized protein n=1 Tax=Mytilus coruscus TaxID=42192 RepID=A0A6J8A024_MYTCO|nr:unnamed protein product [Mytilus coruscus]
MEYTRNFINRTTPKYIATCNETSEEGVRRKCFLLYIKFSAFWCVSKQHEDKYDKNEIKESWRDWLKTNIDYSDRHARRLRNLSRVLEGYPQFGLVGLPVSYFTASKLKDITNAFQSRICAEYWNNHCPRQPTKRPNHNKTAIAQRTCMSAEQNIDGIMIGLLLDLLHSNKM